VLPKLSASQRHAIAKKPLRSAGLSPITVNRPLDQFEIQERADIAAKRGAILGTGGHRVEFHGAINHRLRDGGIQGPGGSLHHEDRTPILPVMIPKGVRAGPERRYGVPKPSSIAPGIVLMAGLSAPRMSSLGFADSSLRQKAISSQRATTTV
jgi:hypothetical protein